MKLWRIVYAPVVNEYESDTESERLLCNMLSGRWTSLPSELRRAACRCVWVVLFVVGLPIIFFSPHHQPVAINPQSDCNNTWELAEVGNVYYGKQASFLLLFLDKLVLFAPPPRFLLAASYISVVYFLLYLPFLRSPLMATFFYSRVFSAVSFSPSFLLLAWGTCYTILSQYYRNFSLMILFDLHCLSHNFSCNRLRTPYADIKQVSWMARQIVSLDSVLRYSSGLRT